jgi:cold shock CspA family protein
MQRLLPGVRTGRVLCYASHKGFGFIEDQETEAQVFVHYSSLVRKEEGRRDLWVGEYVNFVVLPDESGRMGARAVRGINGGPLMCESRTVVPFP